MPEVISPLVDQLIMGAAPAVKEALGVLVANALTKRNPRGELERIAKLAGYELSADAAIQASFAAKRALKKKAGL